MISKLFLTKILLILAIPFCYSQGQMVFTEESFDFGNVVEGTQAVHEFQFVNKGNEPIVISNVQASCGCTTPFWTKDPVAPGSKGVIKASYNSQGRPGAFTKTITVTSNAKTPSKSLTIRGTVVAKPLISPSSKAKFNEIVYTLGKVALGKRYEKTINVVNEGNSVLSFNSLKSNCNCITYKSLPEDLKPGESAEIQLYYIPKQLGNFTEQVVIATNDKNTPESKIYLRAEVEEDKSLNSVVKESKSTIPFN